MGRSRKRWGVVAIAITFLCVFLVSAAFLFRGVILNWAFIKVQQSALVQYNTIITADSVLVKGVTGAQIRGLLVSVKDRDTLMRVDTLTIYPNLFRLLLGEFAPAQVVVKGARITLNTCTVGSNLPTRRVASDRGVALPEKPRFSGIILRNWRRLNQLLPSKLDAEALQLRFITDVGDEAVMVPRMHWDADSLEGNLTQGRYTWHAAGTLGKDTIGEDALFSLNFTHNASGYLPLPQLRQLLNMQLGLSALELTLRKAEVSADNVHFTVEWQGKEVVLQQPRLSVTAIRLDSTAGAVQLRATPTAVWIDSSSRVSINSLGFRPYAYASISADTAWALSIKTDTLAAQAFVSALPAAVFSSTQGMQVQGRLAYHLRAAYSTTKRDTAEFDADFYTENFKLLRYGAVNLGKIREPFTHRTYREGREIEIRPESTTFTFLEEVSPYLKDAVLTSEDGNFYAHRGFNIKAIRRSIAENFQKGRFVRGGSTLTMQLVKNVFLRPEKTLARKLEEALLVWLIETQHLVSKDRMLEVYLNAIEWGPGVYGLHEASRYYFERHPAQLYLPQAIFLAMIVPSPRSYAYNFENASDSLQRMGVPFSLKPFAQKYFELIGNILLAQGKITQEQYDALDYRTLHLQGEAAKYVKAQLREKQPDDVKAVQEIEEEMEELELDGP